MLSVNRPISNFAVRDLFLAFTDIDIKQIPENIHNHPQR